MKRNSEIQKLARIKPENYAGQVQKIKIQVLRSKDYEVQNGYTITGDAPKEFIKVYDPKTSKRTNKKTWPLYLAKTARKWYPNESIIEYLLNQIGVVWGLNMAESDLVLCNGQIRFLSKYFLKKEEVLVHCANLYAKCFNGDQFITHIEKNNLEKKINNIQLFKNCVSMAYGHHANIIFSEFIKMILFDALVGNNDRHFYNYGIIESINSNSEPRFTPIYDTARGLLWNISDKKIISLRNDKKAKQSFLEKYIRDSKPKIGWHNNQDIDHFQMVQFIKSTETGLNKQTIKEFFDNDKLNASITLLDKKFNVLLNAERLELVKQCLILRFNKLKEIFK